MKKIGQQIADFFNKDIWSYRITSISPRKSLWIRSIRIGVLSVKNFYYDQCFLRAAAITFYSMLSLVPMVALLIGVAKGFGYEQKLQQYLVGRFVEQREVIERIFVFAQSMLQISRGGVVAGVGVLLLFWAAIKLIENIEVSFNHIWRVSHNRPVFNRVSYYLVILMVAPFALIVAGSANIFITTRMHEWLNNVSLINGLASPLLELDLKLLPYFMMWLLFTFLYKFLPNTKVSWFSAVVGGIFGGTLFQLLQESYIVLQVAVFSKYKAVYGSFSALPLFLLWLQFTWLIVLFGAEVVFAHQNAGRFELEIFTDKVSIRSFKTYAVRTAAMLVKNFLAHGPAMDIDAVSMQGRMSIGLSRQVLELLQRVGVIFEAVDHTDGRRVYQPACDAADLSVWEVMSRVERCGLDRMIGEDHDFERIDAVVGEIESCGEKAVENVKIRDL
ncbi:MAG: YihY/virulence factor BrkB family protein [Victivallales bacterium]|nr:YihY/virulence factor BrkB family protein [Victivallales bacterium]